eukprot:6335032-Lingulodinium_polyedra.AAC.1
MLIHRASRSGDLNRVKRARQAWPQLQEWVAEQGVLLNPHALAAATSSLAGKGIKAMIEELDQLKGSGMDESMKANKAAYLECLRG